MSKRSEKVSSQMHREVAELLQTRLRDPRLVGLTVTRVEVSNDLHYAWVYVDFVSHPGDTKVALAALAKASGFLRSEIRQSLRMRYTPELIFRDDKGLEHSERIRLVLQELKARGEIPSDEPALEAGEPGAETDGSDAETDGSDAETEGEGATAETS